MTTTQKERLSHELRRQAFIRFREALSNPHFWCTDCQSITEPIESDQGQPTKCAHCGSHRLQYHAGL